MIGPWFQSHRGASSSSPRSCRPLSASTAWPAHRVTRRLRCSRRACERGISPRPSSDCVISSRAHRRISTSASFRRRHGFNGCCARMRLTCASASATPGCLPPEVLAVPPLGVLNGHPSLLPRWRGPFPIAWTVREGDAEIGLTFHLMDDRFDTGPILAQGSVPIPDEYDWPAFEPCLAGLAQNLLPRALARLADGAQGEPQSGDGAYAGPFPAEFSELDLSQPAAVVHRHVASWRFVFLSEGERGPLTALDGVRVRVLRTSLDDPGGGEARLDCADRPLWVLESETVTTVG